MPDSWKFKKEKKIFYGNLHRPVMDLSFVHGVFSKRLLLFLFSGNHGNNPCGLHGLQSSDIVLAVAMSLLIEMHTHTPMQRLQFDKVVKEGVAGYWLDHSYSVWYSGKYPTHALNKGDGERQTPDLKEQILVFTGGRFTCSALFLFQTLSSFVLWRKAGVSGHFHWLSLKLFVLTSQLMFTAKHSCWVGWSLWGTVENSMNGRAGTRDHCTTAC